MESLQKRLASASNSLRDQGAQPPQIEAFKAEIDQVRSALENDSAALISSSVVKTLFTKSIGAAIAFNRSGSRLENDPEQGALFESIATIEEVCKTPSAEAALLKAGVVKAVPHLLSVLLGTDDDVECREAAVSCLIELMRQKTIKKALQKTDFSDAASSFSASNLLLTLNSNQLQMQVVNLIFLLGSRASQLRKEALLPYFDSAADLSAADKAMHQGDLTKYGEMVATALRRLNSTGLTPITPVPAQKLNVFGKAFEGGCLFFGDTMVEIQLPGKESFPLRLAKSITKFELKLVGSSLDSWKVTLGIEKSKALEHKGTLAQISCLLDAATANRLRAHTIPAIPATVPIFEQEDQTVASSNMSSGNGLLPPMKSPASALKKPPASASKKPTASAAKKPPASAAKKPSVPAAAKDPFDFDDFELDDPEPRSNDSASKPKTSRGKPLEAAAKTTTPAAGKATAKPPAKESGKSTSASNDGGKKVESEAQRPARKQPAQPAPKEAAPKQPAPKQPASKQPVPKQPAPKQPGWVEPADPARSGSAKVFGRKSTPKVSGKDMRGKDVHSAPDLDDVFDFAPAEIPLPRGATGSKKSTEAGISPRDAVFGATGREACKAVKLAKHASKENHGQQQNSSSSGERKDSVLQPVEARGQRKQQTKGSQAAARKAVVQQARQQLEEDTEDRAKDFEQAQAQAQAHAPRVEKPSGMESEAAGVEEDEEDDTGPRDAPTRKELEKTKVTDLQKLCKERSVQVEKSDKKADLVEKLVDDIAVERQLAAADKSSKVTPAAARRKSDGGKSSLKSLRWADRVMDQEDSGQTKCIKPSSRTAAAAVAVEEEGGELPWDGEMGDPLADEMVDEAATAEAHEPQQGADEAGVSEERGMDDDIWQEEMRKERCSSPSIEDEDMDEEGGQSEAADEDKQPEGGEMEHEAVQETGDAEESQLILTMEEVEADPGGTHEVATPLPAAAAGDVLVPATDEVAAQEPEEPEEQEDLWGDREAERGAEESAVQDETGAEDEAAEHGAEGAEAAAEEGADPVDGEAELAEEEPAEEEAAEEEPVKVHGALGGGSGSEDEDEDEVSEDDEPCTAEQQDVAKKAKGVVKEVQPTKPLPGRSGAKVSAKPGGARSSAKVIKRPNTGFQLFSFEKRVEVSEQLPGGDSKEVMKLLSETWKELRSSERVQYNERAASVPVVGTALLVRRVVSGTVQGELSGWHAGEVHAMLQGASFLIEVEGEAGMLEMRVEDQGTAWRPVQDNGGDDFGDDGEVEPRRRVSGKAKASTAAPAPAKKRANLNPFYHSSDESEAGHKEDSDADSDEEDEVDTEALLRQAQQMLADKKAGKAAQRDRAKAKKAAATKGVEQAVAIEAMDEDDDEAEVEAEAGRRGRSLSTPGGGGAARGMAMSPELSADTPSLSLDGGGMGLQQVASACESVQLAISDHKTRRVADDAAHAKQLLTAQLKRSAASVRSAAETQVGPKHLQARVDEYRRLSETLSALEVAEQEASSVRQHEERQMRGAAEKLRLETKELKRKLQTIGTDAHVNMDQLTVEFKQETKTLKKKAKRDMQKINQNAAIVQQLYAEQINDDDLDDDDDL